MKRLLDRDPYTGITTWFHKDPVTGTIAIEEIQDVDPILEKNKTIQNLGSGGAMGLTDYSRKGIKNGFWHAASIPTTLIQKWLLEEGINVFKQEDWPRVKRKLNDPEYKYLRTGLGRV